MAFAAADLARLADDLQAIGQQQRRRVAGAVGFELLDGLHDAGGQRGERNLGVDGQAMRVRLGAELAGDDGAEVLAEDVDRFGQDAEARRRRVAAVADEIGGAFLQRLVQLEAGDRAAGTLAVRLAFAQRDHQDGAGVLIDEPAGDDAEQAGMPFGAGQHERRAHRRRARPARVLPARCGVR